VTTAPRTNTISPSAITEGITSGRFTTRTAISRIAPNANAGSQWTSWNPRIRTGTVRRWIDTCDETYIPPLKSSQPVPARKPPTTGYGTNRTRLPSRYRPRTQNTTPHRTVTISVAAITVRKMSGAS
jgi:hypothetical protein